MDISRTRVVLRQRAVVDIVDLAVRFVAEHWLSYLKVSCAVVPPFFLGSWLVGRMAGPVWAWGFAVFASFFAATPFTLLASRLVFDDDVRVGSVVKGAFALTPKLFVIRVMTVMVGSVGLVLFFFPGVWVLTLMLFAGEVVSLERMGFGAAASRSARLARREAGQAVPALVLLVLVHALVVIVVDSGGRALVTALLESTAPVSLWESGWSPLSLLGYWLFVPYAATGRFFTYLDVRTRSEGWDIQTRFSAIATRTPVERSRSAA